MSSTLQFSDKLTIASGATSLVVALAALLISLYAIYRGNRNSSAATMVTLNVAFRDAWDRFHEAKGDRQEFHFAELMNLFEIACAIHQENSLAGVSHGLVGNYMEEILGEIVKNPYAEAQVPKLLSGPTTFRHIKDFLKDRPRTLSVTIPIKWYQRDAL